STARRVTQMRLFGIVLNSSVQAERHGPSMTTRSPLARTAANSRRYSLTSPPGLDRIRTSPNAGARAANKNIVAQVIRRTDILPFCFPQRRTLAALRPLGGRPRPNGGAPVKSFAYRDFHDTPAGKSSTRPPVHGMDSYRSESVGGRVKDDSPAARRTLPGSLSGSAPRPHRGRPGGRQYAG